MVVEKNIEKSLNNSICQAPTLDFNKLAAMPVVKMTEHDYITRRAPAIAGNSQECPAILNQSQRLWPAVWS